MDLRGRMIIVYLVGSRDFYTLKYETPCIVILWLKHLLVFLEDKSSLLCIAKQAVSHCNAYVVRKVASSRPVYYSILDHFVQRSQYTSFKISLQKQSENVKMCY